MQLNFFNAAIYLGFSAASSLLGMAAVLMLTRLLPPAEYGNIGVFFSLLYLVVPLVSLSCDGLIAVNKTTLDPQRYEVFQRTYLGMAYLSFAGVQVIMIVLWLSGQLGNWLLALTPLFALVRFIAGMAGTEYIVEQRPIIYGTLTLLTSVIALALTIALTEFLGAWSGYRILALLVADIIVLAARYHGRLRVLCTPKIVIEHRRQILAYGIPGLLCLPGAWGMNEADKMIVAKLAGIDVAGLYAAGAGLSVIMLTFLQSLTNALYPGMFRALAAKNSGVGEILMRYAFGFVLSSSLFCALVLCAYFWIGDRLLPARYLGAEPMFVALMLACLAISIYRPFGLAADYFKLARARSVAILLGGVVTVLVAYVGVSNSGPIWAAVGIAVGYLIAAVIIAAALALHARER